MRTRIIPIALLALLPQLAHGYYVCTARPKVVKPGEKLRVFQRHGFSRKEGRANAKQACETSLGRECVAGVCTDYQLSP